MRLVESRFKVRLYAGTLRLATCSCRTIDHNCTVQRSLFTSLHYPRQSVYKVRASLQSDLSNTSEWRTGASFGL
jgi:hypothetical protein